MPQSKPTFNPPLAPHELTAAEAAEHDYGLPSGKAATMTRLISQFVERHADVEELAEFNEEQLMSIYDDAFFLFFSLYAAKRGVTPATFADRENARALSVSRAADE